LRDRDPAIPRRPRRDSRAIECGGNGIEYVLARLVARRARVGAGVSASGPWLVETNPIQARMGTSVKLTIADRGPWQAANPGVETGVACLRTFRNPLGLHRTGRRGEEASLSERLAG